MLALYIAAIYLPFVVINKLVIKLLINSGEWNHDNEAIDGALILGGPLTVVLLFVVFSAVITYLGSMDLIDKFIYPHVERAFIKYIKPPKE